jgi:acyl carrier protein
MRQPLEKILAEVFGVNPSDITDSTSPDTLSSWDSFNGLKLVEALEKNYKIKLNIEDMAKVKNVADIKNLLKKYGRL